MFHLKGPYKVYYTALDNGHCSVLSIMQKNEKWYFLIIYYLALNAELGLAII